MVEKLARSSWYGLSELGECRDAVALLSNSLQDEVGSGFRDWGLGLGYIADVQVQKPYLKDRPNWCSQKLKAHSTAPYQTTLFQTIYIYIYGSFRKLGVPYFGVLIIRILLFRVLYWGPLFSETPIYIYIYTHGFLARGSCRILIGPLQNIERVPY